MANSKWLVALLLFLLILGVLYFLGRKSAHSEIVIDAPPTEVWAVLIDTENYGSWNPVMKLLEGELKEGATVKYEFRQDEQNKSEIPSRVKKIIPNQLLNQGGGMPGVITFDHQYLLEDLNGKTKVTIHEDYRGIYVTFWNPAPVENAYERLNQDLKERVESFEKNEQ